MSASPKDSERSHTRGRAADGVEANARLTGSTAAVLFVLLAAEGVTILRVRPLLSWHVFIGMLLVPPVALKIGTTSYRFVRYYRGSPAYRRKGPPPSCCACSVPSWWSSHSSSWPAASPFCWYRHRNDGRFSFCTRPVSYCGSEPWRSTLSVISWTRPSSLHTTGSGAPITTWPERAFANGFLSRASGPGFFSGSFSSDRRHPG